MKTLAYLWAACMLLTECVVAQSNNIDAFIAIKPAQIPIAKPSIQVYDVSLKWQNLDALSGTKFNCNEINANYSISADNENVSWNNVFSSTIKDFNSEATDRKALSAFNNFTYKALNTDFLRNDFYKSIPVENRDLAKWLVSDAIQMQALAWYVFDSMTFNKKFVPLLLKDYDVKFEDWVTFTSRYQKLIWDGITTYNDEICAVVKFESYYNPLEINNQDMSLKGRSLYWGEMWISLSDKQVEYSKMFEDVVFRLKSTAFPQEQLLDLQREIVFTKRPENK